ncbi:AI-2E family transporter [Canibacter zhoujuaniae]|uniref:AI-2E family transporter n=1 Tax=Canibacter zhoujuaniae TaxID=2708343 RepID=UPI001FBBF387|nr:AI-2E family transporter [Canibacter zhoujuaniae]
MLGRLFRSHTEAQRVEDTRRMVGAWGDGFGLFATRSLQIIIILILATAATLGLGYLKSIFIPVLIAVILASTFNPVMVWLRARKVPSVLATLIVLLGVLAAFVGMGWLIVWAVQNQWAELSQRAEEGYNKVLVFVRDLPFEIPVDRFEEVRDQAVEYATSSGFLSGVAGGLSSAGTGATAVVLTIVVLFFFLKDGQKIWAFLCRPFRGENYARVQRIGAASVDTFGAYVRGTAMVALVDAVGIGIGLLILQVPLALPLAVLVFVLAFIPIVGAVTAGVLAALVALVSNGLTSALIVVALVILVNQLEGNLLQPVLMGNALSLHALVVLLALAVGTVTNGILGAVLAAPLLAVVWGAVKVWNGKDEPADWAKPSAREKAMYK